MKHRIKPMVDVSQRVHALQHIETSEFICLRQGGKEYLACFTDGDSAYQFRDELGLLEYVDIASLRLGDAPFDNFWLDGEMLGRGVLTDHQATRR
jgi:hypothetical protein